MSSAILYVAIVAIWAGVLIPRWLRRDSPSGGQVSDDTVTTEAPVEEEPPEPPRQREDPAPRARSQQAPAAAVLRSACRTVRRPALRMTGLRMTGLRMTGAAPRAIGSTPACFPRAGACSGCS